MTDFEIENILNDMEQMLGPLPDPEIYPRQFDFFLRMYKHRKEIRDATTSVVLQESNTSVDTANTSS